MNHLCLCIFWIFLLFEIKSEKVFEVRCVCPGLTLQHRVVYFFAASLRAEKNGMVAQFVRELPDHRKHPRRRFKYNFNRRLAADRSHIDTALDHLSGKLSLEVLSDRLEINIKELGACALADTVCGEVLMDFCFESERGERRNAKHQLKRVRHATRELLEPDHGIAPTRRTQFGDAHASARHRAADGDIEHSLLQWSAIEDVCLGFQKFIVPLLLIVLAGVRQGVQNTCLELFKLTERFWVIFASGGLHLPWDCQHSSSGDTSSNWS